MSSVKELEGKTVISFVGAEIETENITINCSDGSVYSMYHDQECCEHVFLVEIIGDISDLIGTPIVLAEERSNYNDDHDLGRPEGYYHNDSEQWTFYELRTIKGSVTLRWFGCSNGYYSTSVYFKKIV